MQRTVRLAALTGLLLSFAPIALAQDAAFKATTLALVSTGEVRAAPDMATVMLGVDNRAPIPGDAMRATSDTMAKVVAAIKAQGIADRDIQTTGLTLNPQINVVNGVQTVSTYQASNTVNIVVRNVARVSAVIDAAIASGGSIVRSVTFGLQDPGPAQDNARRDAVTDLTNRAALYAQLTGYKVSRMVSMNESQAVSNFSVAAPAAGGGRGGAGPAATPVEPGQIAVRINVSATYELTR